MFFPRKRYILSNKETPKTEVAELRRRKVIGFFGFQVDVVDPFEVQFRIICEHDV